MQKEAADLPDCRSSGTLLPVILLRKQDLNRLTQELQGSRMEVLPLQFPKRWIEIDAGCQL